MRFINDAPKIAIFRALQLGDLLCSIPAIRSLRSAYPSAEITLLGLPWAASFVARFKMYFNKFIHFPGFHGLPEQTYSQQLWNQFEEIMRKENFDLIIQMQGNGTIVNEMLQNLNAKQLAGFYRNDCNINSPLFIEYPEHINEIEKHILLMHHLGIPSTGTYLEFPLYKKDERDFEALLLPVIPHKYTIIHPGSRSESRQWSPIFFAALADYCIEQGFTAIITGTSEEIDITREVVKSMKHTPIDLTGKTSLGAVAMLIKDAGLLISNCTGVSHIAAAFKTRSVVISMDGEPERWSPINTELHKIIDWTREPHFEKVFEETVRLIKSQQLQLSITNN